MTTLIRAVDSPVNSLQQIRFDDGSLGFQETDEDGQLLRLYDADGDQFAQIVDADGHGAPRSRTWEFVRDLGEFADSDGFWDLVFQQR